MKPRINKFRHFPNLFTVGICLGMSVAGIHSVQAQTPITWGNTATDFATGTNWVLGSAPTDDTITNIATFSGSPVFQPVLALDRSVNGLAFQSGGWTLSGAKFTVGNGGVTSTGNNAITAELAQSGNANYSSASGGKLTVNSALTGNTVTFGTSTNTGTVELTGTADNNSLSPIVAYGTLLMNKSGGGGSSASNLTVDLGATAQYGSGLVNRSGSGQPRGQIYGTATINGTLDLNGQGSSLYFGNTNNWVVTLNGSGSVTNNGSGTAQLGARGGTFSGSINDGSNTTSLLVLNGQTFNWGGAGTFSGGITTTGTLNLNDNLLGGGDYSGVITGTGAVSYNAAGKTQTLSAVNTYSGQTTINNGTLKLGNALALGDGTSVSFNITTTNASNAATVAANTPIAVGMYVTGTGIPANTRVNAYTAGTGAVTLSFAATADGTVPGTFVGSTSMPAAGTLDLNGLSIAESFSDNSGSFINSNTSTAAQLTSEMVDLGNPKFDGPGDITVSNILRSNSSGTRRIYKNGAGTLTLGGDQSNNRYGLTVNEGDVILDKSSGEAISRFALIMNNASSTVTLQGKGDQIVDSTDVLHEINAGTLDLNGFNEQISQLGTTNGTETDGIVTNSNGGTTSIFTLAGGTVGLTDIFTFPGAIKGNLALVKGNTNTQILKGTNTFTGGTTVGRGTLVLGSGGSFPATNTLVMGSGGNSGTFRLGDATAAVNTTVTSLSSSGSGTANEVTGGNPTTASVLTVNSTDPTIDIYEGRLGDGVAGDTDANRVSLVKQGTGALRINRAGTYTGGTTLEDGVLSYGANGAFGTGDITINGGRIGIGNSGLTLANKIIAGGNFAIGSESGLSGGASGLFVSGDLDLGGATREITIRRTTTLAGVISNGGLTFIGVGSNDNPDSGRTLYLDGANTYTGSTTILSGILSVTSTGSLSDETDVLLNGGTMELGSGVYDTVKSLTITGEYGNAPLPAGEYGLGAANGGFGSALDAYFTGAGRLVIEASATPYDTWKSVNAPTGDPFDDYDGDGVANAVEFVLGGLATTNDLDKLPKLSTSGGNLLFSFERDQSSIDESTTVTIEVSTDLDDWSETYAVPDDAAASDPGVTVEKGDPVTVPDTVTLSVVQAPDTKKFARLKVVIAE